MKKICAFVLVMSLLLCVCPATQASSTVMKEFYVNPFSGNDAASGDSSAPLKTIECARDAVREYISQNGGIMTGDIVVNLAEGRYELDDYLQLREADSGKNGYKVIYQGAGAKKSVISGGTSVDGWEQRADGLWIADASEFEFARDLYVNEVAARRAASQKSVTGVANYLAEDSYYDLSDGFYASKSQIQTYKNPEDVVLHWTIAWKDYQIAVKDIIDDPSNSDRVIVKLENPVWNSIMTIKDNPSTRVRLWPTYDKGFIVENALELLDEPGEFYFDKSDKKLYYYPRVGEDMQTATVIVPRLERLVRIDGNDYYHQVSGIAFRDVGFAHTTNPLAENTSYCNQQGECPTCPQQGANRTPGAFEVNWANNIEVSDCAVWGTELAGISFNDGVDNSSITGTSFTDIGSAAAIIGSVRHTYTAQPADRTVPGNVVFLKRWTASYNYVVDGANAMAFFNGGSTGNEFEYRSGTAATAINGRMWKNEPWAEDDGIKSWVMFDLENEYKLESIRLSFEEDCVGTTASAAERSNFEVLLSNDEDFESYQVVKTFTEPAADVEEIPVDLAEGYRYLMIRKTKAEPFAIYGVWAYSYDREPLGNMGLCENITFENNYIARAGRVHNQAPSLLVCLTKGTNVRYNEIVDSAYSGISLGWGWESVNYTVDNNIIANNLIDRFGLRTDDGGGIYILGNQRNLKITGNVVKNQGNMYGGIYFDSGSSNATVQNNVILNTSNTFMFWNDVNEISTGPITLSSNYSDMNQVARYDGDAYINLEDIKVFTPDNPPEPAVQIVAEAGLQEAYGNIREINAPDTPWLKGTETAMSYHRADNASTRATAFISVAENLLDNAQFGNLPWQYTYEDYYAIEKALADIKNDSNRTTDYSNGHILEEYALKEAIETANEGIVHPSYEEMVALCESLLEGASTSGELRSYPEYAVSDLQTALKYEEELTFLTETEKALAANRLEKAVSVFEASRIDAEPEYAYIEGGVTEVDRENRKITITLPFSASLTGLDTKTSISQGAELETDLSTADFSKPVSVTVKHTATGLTSQWTLEVKREEPIAENAVEVSAVAEEWINSNPNTVMPVSGDILTIQPSDLPYVYNKVAETSASWKIKLDNPETVRGISLIFGGKRKNLEPGVKEDNNSYHLLTLSGQTMTLSRVTEGTETALTSTESAGFNYGGFNDVKVVCESSLIKIFVNDVQVLSSAITDATAFEGYCGVYTPASVAEIAGEYYSVERVNVAKDRAVFTSFSAPNTEPSFMVDGNMSSAWSSNKVASVITGKYIWAYVDLGAEYTVDQIKIITENNDAYISRDRQDYRVYVTNTRPETDIAPDTPVDVSGMTEVYAAPSCADGTECASVENTINVGAISATRGNKYRYVFLQKTNISDTVSGGTSGMGHWYWSIRELIVNTTNVVGENAPYWKEVAKNRPAFAGEVYQDDTYAARMANDGNVGTAYIAADWSSGIRSRLVIDLEKEYPIEAVVLTPRYNSNELKGFEIYGTNDNLFVDMDLIHKQSKDTAANYGHLYYEAPEGLKGNKYRYIVVQADTANNNLSVMDLKVYTSDLTASQPFKANNAYITSINAPVSSDCNESTYPFKNMTDADSASACLISSGNSSGYLSVDLLKPQTVDYVTYAIEGFNLYHYGMEVIASNNKDLSDGAVLYSAKNEDGTYFCPISETDTKGILVFPATAEMEGKRYRYVGIRFPKNTKTSTQIVRGGANLFEVYTKGSNLNEALSGMTVTQSGTAFTADINDLVTLTNTAYSFVAAAYDGEGRLVAAKTAEIPAPTQGKRHTTPITAAVDFADVENRQSVTTVKAMLWDSVKNLVKPIIEALDIVPDDYVAVTSTAETTSYYAQLQSAGWAVNYTDANGVTATMFTDNNSGTVYGRGQGGDAAWIDLGESMRIDKVRVQINDQYMSVPSSPMMIYVTNENPYEALAANTDEDGYFTAPGNWVAVNGEGHVWTSAGVQEVTYNLPESGKYRYVVVTDPSIDMNDGTAYNGAGLQAYVAEITPYAKAFSN